MCLKFLQVRGKNKSKPKSIKGPQMAERKRKTLANGQKG